jgi:hypothetical protein
MVKRGWDTSYWSASDHFFQKKGAFTLLYWFCIAGGIPVFIYTLPCIDVFWIQLITELYNDTVEIKYVGTVSILSFERDYLGSIAYIGPGLLSGICCIIILSRIRKGIKPPKEYKKLETKHPST